MNVSTITPSTRPKHQTSKPKTPKVLAMVDVDKTLLPWDIQNKTVHEDRLDNNRNVFLELKDKVGLFLLTNRTITSLKATLPFLKGFPVLGLGLNGGQEIYINHKKQPITQWLQNLTRDSQDMDWQTIQIKNYGWSRQKAADHMFDLFKRNGFKQAQSFPKDQRHYEGTQILLKPSQKIPGQTLLIEAFRDETNFLIQALNNPDPKLRQEALQIGEELKKQFVEEFKRQNIDSETIHATRPKWERIWFAHPRVQKDNAADYLTGKYDANAVITIGDDANDERMLNRSSFKGKNGPVPAYPVVAGDRVDFNQISKHIPVAERTVVDADLKEATLKQIAKIEEQQSGL